MNIGFDYDKVFINYPPIIPDFLINFFYRRGTMFFLGKKEKKLLYRFPGPWEQRLRIFSHSPFLRSPIKENVESLKKIKKRNMHTTHLITSRYSFLKNRTDKAIKKNGLSKCFNSIHLNYENNQPHEFKEQTLKKLKIDAFIDDDLATLKYIANKNHKIKLYWLSKNPHSISDSSKIIPVKKIAEIKEFFK